MTAHEPGTGPGNRLADEVSPYLRQHAHNPVDWYPWGEAAWTLARESGRPVFLSIGYSTCHWCHVMERESFADPEVARLLNDFFVAIKVDREERPDLDHLYMAACQAMTGSGGWPLTVFLTPDRRPFFAGTYFPRESMPGRVGMLELLPRVAEAWRDGRADAEAAADRLLRLLTEPMTTGSSGLPGPEWPAAAADSLAGRYDARYGGFGPAPKFPTPHHLTFLLRQAAVGGFAAGPDMVRHTLTAMRRGGVFDQLGFGMHRYSTDGQWRVPHFEKMLHDQALVALAAVETGLATGDPAANDLARDIFAYVERDLLAPEGAFYTAEDADSEGEEGRFYRWTREEFRDRLPGRLGELAEAAWGVEPGGNWVDPVHRVRPGDNILYRALADDALSERFGLGPAELAERLEEARPVLLAARSERPRPLRDDKILTDWNGLMIAALARAAQAWDDPRPVALAARAAGFVWDRMVAPDGGLLHRWCRGQVAVDGMLDDYAFLTWGMLELYGATYDPVWLQRARDLGQWTRERFEDPARGGMYFTSAGAADLPIRRPEWYDGALPSGNAVTAMNLLRLSRLLAEPEWAAAADRLFQAAAPMVQRAPGAYTALLTALTFRLEPGSDVVLVGDPRSAGTRAFARRLAETYLPHTTVVFRPVPGPTDDLDRLAPHTCGLRPVEGRPAAYVCQGRTCDPDPVEDPMELLRRLDHRTPTPGVPASGHS